MKEIEMQKLILDYLQYHKGLFWRNNTVGIFDKSKGIYRKNKGQMQGVADILGVLNGRFIAIEVKAEGISKLSEHQEIFREKFEKNGGIYYLANDFNNFKKWYDSIL